MNNVTAFQIKARAMLCTSLTVLLAACGGGSGGETTASGNQNLDPVYLSSVNANPKSNGYVAPTTTTSTSTTPTTTTPTTTTTTTPTTTTPTTTTPTTTTPTTTTTTTPTTPTTTTTTTTPITTYNLYVSTTGSDSNPGTQSAPFRTISHAGSVALPSTTVHVASGTYIENVVTKTSGTSSAYIYYVSDTLHGAKVVGGSEYHGAAFAVWGSYTKVIGFDITGGGSEGLYMARSFDEAHNNYVHDIPAPGNDGHGGAGINFAEYGQTNGVADSNIVARIGTYVASLGRNGNNKVHGLYAAIPNVTFSNNIVYGANAFAINTGHFSINCIMSNNVLFGNGNPSYDSGGIVITATDSTSPVSNGHRVRNNIIFDNYGTGIHEEGTQGSDIIYSNNLVYQNSAGNFGLLNGHSNTKNLAVNPLFVNYIRSGGGDYRLQSGSPAIDAGTLANIPTADFAGVVRVIGAGADIGAYEQ